MSNLTYYRAQRARCMQAARDIPMESHIFVRIARMWSAKIVEQKRAATAFRASDLARIALERK